MEVLDNCDRGMVMSEFKSIVEFERILKALANKRRLKLLRLMKRRGGSMNVSELARAINLSVRATSQHLVILDRAGLLESRQERLEVFYSLRSKLSRIVREIIKEL